MVEKHRMSITPRGTLTDLVETVFKGKGKHIIIANRNYTLREQGDLTEQNSVRTSMLKDLENYARSHPGVRYSNEIELGSEKREQEEPTLKIRYVKAEEIPNSEEDIGAHQYLIVEGTRYRIDVEGNPEVVKINNNNIIKQGRQMILAYKKGCGELPHGIKIRQTFKIEKRIGPFKFKKKH
jgi:hypothetical protein